MVKDRILHCFVLNCILGLVRRIMYNKEAYDNTRKLLKDLKYFMIHVLTYIPANILIVLYTLNDVSSNWWIFFPLMFWAVLLVWHSANLYSESNENQLKAFSM